MSGRVSVAELSSSTVIGPSATRSASRKWAITYTSWDGMNPKINPIRRSCGSTATRRFKQSQVASKGWLVRWPAGDL
jgi:hypothetical protein